jgi:hypothetical protein
LYAFSPEPPASVEAFQLTLTCRQLTATAATPVGVSGGVVSMACAVVALATFEYPDAAPFRAKAWTR